MTPLLVFGDVEGKLQLSDDQGSDPDDLSVSVDYHVCWCLCNAMSHTIYIWYPPETHLKLKSHEISFVRNIRFSCSTKTMGLLRNKLWLNESSRDLGLRCVSYIAQHPRNVKLSKCRDIWRDLVGQAWMNNYTRYVVWDEIMYLYSNLIN